MPPRGKACRPCKKRARRKAANTGESLPLMTGMPVLNSLTNAGQWHWRQAMELFLTAHEKRLLNITGTRHAVNCNSCDRVRRFQS